MNKHRTASNALRLVLDIVSLTAVGVLLLLTLVFSPKISHWQQLATSLLIAGLLYAMMAWIVRLLPAGLVGVGIHIVAAMALYSHIFQELSGLQHVFVEGWMDQQLLSLERALTGSEIVVMLQKYVHPFLTEWMMFAYVVYVPLLPIVAFICYRAAGTRATYDYLLSFALVNVLCSLGFILYPVASPLFYSPEKFTVPLQGGIFTWCGEWIRANMHYPGGSLPSPHCAAGTVMMVMLYRYCRSWWYGTLPVYLTIYGATVYGRYHYLCDSITGILVAVLVLRFTPALVAALTDFVEKAGRTFVPGQVEPATASILRREEL